MIFKRIYLTLRWDSYMYFHSGLLEVMSIMRYATLLRSPEREPCHEMQFFFLRGRSHRPLQGILSVYFKPNRLGGCRGYRRYEIGRRAVFKSWTKTCTFLCALSLKNGMDLSFLLSVINKIAGHIVFLNLARASSLGEGKTLNSNFII